MGSFKQLTFPMLLKYNLTYKMYLFQKMRYICVYIAAMGLFISNPSILSLGPWFSACRPQTFLETRSQLTISFQRKTHLKARRILSMIQKHFHQHSSDVFKFALGVLPHGAPLNPCNATLITTGIQNSVDADSLTKENGHQPGPYLSCQEPSSDVIWRGFFRLFCPL